VKFVPPLVVLLFAATMLGIWMLDTKRRHLLLFGLSFASFAFGLLVPISLISNSLTLTSPIATTFHFMGGWLLCEGVMIRMGGRYSRLASGLIGLGLLGAMIYFIANDTSYARIAPAVQLTLGSLVAVLCIQARDLARRSWIERVLFGALLLLTVHFYVQAGMALGLSPEIARPSELIHSRYWQGIMIFGAFAGVFAGLVLLVVTTSDVVKELQAERDSDPLTGVSIVAALSVTPICAWPRPSAAIMGSSSPILTTSSRSMMSWAMRPAIRFWSSSPVSCKRRQQTRRLSGASVVRSLFFWFMAMQRHASDWATGSADASPATVFPCCLQGAN